MRTAELRILCEGETEYNFVNRVLKEHLRLRGVFVKDSINLRTNLRGVKPFEHLRDKIRGDLGRLRGHQYITTMLDLYALPNYPGDPGRRVSGRERAQRIQAAMHAELPSPQFIPYIQVHEFEALVFVDLHQLGPQFPDGEATGALEQLERERHNLAPEEINDGPQTAPSKRLIRAVPAYDDVKALAGPEIAARIGLPRLRAACPHFDGWVSSLERLGPGGAVDRAPAG